MLQLNQQYLQKKSYFQSTGMEHANGWLKNHKPIDSITLIHSVDISKMA